MQRILTDVVHCARPGRGLWLLHTSGQLQVVDLQDYSSKTYPFEQKIDVSRPMAYGKEAMICLDARTAVFCQLGEESSISSKQISFSSDIICADDGLVLLSNGQLYNIVDGEVEAKIDLNMGVLSAAFFYEEKQRRLIIGRENDAVCCDVFTKELS